MSATTMENDSTTPKLSTMPGFQKYPTYRDDSAFRKSGVVWLEGKRHDDGAEGLWRIRDKLYDLTSFIDSHPGGPDWLRLTKGTDITEAFQIHHFTQIPEQLLQKFFIRQVNTPRNSPYKFEENGFYKTLKRRIIPILAEHGKGPNNQMIFFHNSLFSVFIILMMAASVFHSFILASLAGIAASLTIVASHNFFHQKDNWRMYLYDLSFLSFLDWRITHVLSHHIYTNTLSDWEISGFEPFFEYLPRTNKIFVQRYGILVYWHLINFTMFFQELAKRIYAIATRMTSLKWFHLIPFAELTLMIFCSSSTLYGFALWFMLHAVASYCFLLIGLTAAHHHPLIFHDGDSPPRDLDWGLCQLDAVRDRIEIRGNMYFTTIVFGDHALHHLFPTVDHSKLPLLQQVFEETCVEFGVDYTAQYMSTWELCKGTFMQLARVTTNPIPPRDNRH